MTGICLLCQQLVSAECCAVPAGEREQTERLGLLRAMALHIFTGHRDIWQREIAPAASRTAEYLASLCFDGSEVEGARDIGLGRVFEGFGDARFCTVQRSIVRPLSDSPVGALMVGLQGPAIRVIRDDSPGVTLG